MVHDESVIFSDAVAEQFKAADKISTALENYIIANKEVLNNPHVAFAANQLSNLQHAQYGTKPKACLSLESLEATGDKLALESIAESLSSGIKARFSAFFWAMEYIKKGLDDNDKQVQVLKQKWNKAREDYNDVYETNPSFKDKAIDANESMALYLCSHKARVSEVYEVMSELADYKRKLTGNATKASVKDLNDSLVEATKIIRQKWFFSDKEDMLALDTIYEKAKEHVIALGERAVRASKAYTYETDFGLNGITTAVIQANSDKEATVEIRTNNPSVNDKQIKPIPPDMIGDLDRIFESFIEDVELDKELRGMIERLRSQYGWTAVNGVIRLGAIVNGIIGGAVGAAGGAALGAGATVAAVPALVAGAGVGALAGFALNASDIRKSMMITNVVENYRVFYMEELRVRNETLQAMVDWLVASRECLQKN